MAAALAAFGLPAAHASADSSDTQATVTLQISSQMTVTASANPAAFGSNLTLTATFAAIAGNEGIAPTGAVSFFDDNVLLGTGTLSGQAASWTGQLPVGEHSITASYDGDANYTTGLSDPLPLTVAYVPAVSMVVVGGDPSPSLPSDGTWSSQVGLTATSNPGASDLPHTIFSVTLSGIAGLTPDQVELQQNIAGTWVTVPLTEDLPGVITGVVGVDSDLAPGQSVGMNLRLRAVRGGPSGTLSVSASLLGSSDGQDWSGALASTHQDFTVQPDAALITTTTTVTASSIVTDASTSPVQLTATVVPSAATGTVTFLDNGNPVGASTLSGGTATFTPTLALGYHSISASYAGNHDYATSTGSQLQQVSVSPPGGSLHAIAPVRLLDTRVGNGAAQATLAPNATLVLQVTGRGGIPSTGVAAVSVNVTVVSPISAGYVTLYPTGGQVPGTADVDFPKTATTAGLAMSQLSAAGKLSILNKSASPINVVADVSAWFGQPTNSMDEQGRYNAVVPFRLLDTRKAPNHQMTAGSTVAIQVEGVSTIPATGVSAVMLNVTSVHPSGLGYLVTYPGGQPKPATSTLQFQQDETRAGRVIVGVGSDGKVNLYDSTNTDTDVVVDIVGWFTTADSAAGGTTYIPLKVSQRLGAAQSGGTTLWQSNSMRPVSMAGAVGVPNVSAAIHATAVVTDIHTVNPTGASYLTAYPSAIRPVTSDLDFAIGQNLQNLTVAGLGSSGSFNLYNMIGTVTIPIDVYGWFG